MIYGEHEDKEMKPVLVADGTWNHEISLCRGCRSLQLLLGILWHTERPLGIKAMQVPTCNVGGHGFNYSSSPNLYAG